jgi:hypothetical protein
MKLTNEDLAICRKAFHQFRMQDDESEGDFSNRDELEEMLRTDGELNDLDIYMLQNAVATVLSDDEYAKLSEILRKPL